MYVNKQSTLHIGIDLSETFFQGSCYASVCMLKAKAKDDELRNEKNSFFFLRQQQNTPDLTYIWETRYSRESQFSS